MSQEAYPICRFYVEVDKNKMAQAVFTEVSGLQLEVEMTEYEEGGRNDTIHRFPGRTKVGNLTFKGGMTKSNEFFKWCLEITQGTISRRNVSVIMYDAKGTLLTRWEFLNAYPVKWIGPQLTADGTTAAIETLEIAYEGMKLGN